MAPLTIRTSAGKLIPTGVLIASMCSPRRLVVKMARKTFFYSTSAAFRSGRFKVLEPPLRQSLGDNIWPKTNWNAPSPELCRSPIRRDSRPHSIRFLFSSVVSRVSTTLKATSFFVAPHFEKPACAYVVWWIFQIIEITGRTIRGTCRIRSRPQQTNRKPPVEESTGDHSQ